MAKIQRLEEMLKLLSRPLLDINADTEELARLLGISHEQLTEWLTPENLYLLQDVLLPASLTLEITPLSAFVGDNIGFSGVLSSQGQPLEGREIDILLNDTFYAAVTTDARGGFRGELQVPYWYAPELTVQAVYYPQDPDIGRYLGASSPAVNLSVLYYTADLVIQADGPAYPGLSGKITGKFEYGSAPVIDRQGTELYLDDSLISQFTASSAFTWEAPIAASEAPGKHTVFASVPAAGRYAPVSAFCTLEVVQAPIILDLNIPGLALIPGSLDMKGNLHSTIGPLRDAVIDIELNGHRVQTLSSADGSFAVRFGMDPDWSLLGSETVKISVQAQEPWNASLQTTRTLFMLNFLNCGILLAFLLAFSLYMRRRVQKWLGAYSTRSHSSGDNRSDAAVTGAGYLSSGIDPSRSAINHSSEGEKLPLEDSSSPQSVFQSYRLVFRLIQTLTRTMLKPQQTLREYARENAPRLGTPGKYFLEFTLLIERLLYSHHHTTAEDLEESRRLSQTIHKGVENENL